MLSEFVVQQDKPFLSFLDSVKLYSKMYIMYVIDTLCVRVCLKMCPIHLVIQEDHKLVV